MRANQACSQQEQLVQQPISVPQVHGLALKKACKIVGQCKKPDDKQAYFWSLTKQLFMQMRLSFAHIFTAPALLNYCPCPHTSDYFLALYPALFSEAI